MNLTDFIDDILTLKGDESKASMPIRLFVEHEHGIFNLQRTQASFDCLSFGQSVGRHWGNLLCETMSKKYL